MFPKESYYRRLFFIAAVWNWVATLGFGLGHPIVFPLLGMPPPEYPVFLVLFLGLAFVFGLGYYWVSRDLLQNRGIVKMGVIGKTVVFIGLLWAALIGNISWLLVCPGAVDLVFAILFFDFLSKTGKIPEFESIRGEAA